MSAVKQTEKYAADYIDRNSALIVLQHLVLLSSDACIEDGIKAFQDRSVLCKCFHGGVMRQVSS